MVGKGNKTNQRDTLRACSGVGMLLSVSFSSPSPPLLSLSLFPMLPLTTWPLRLVTTDKRYATRAPQLHQRTDSGQKHTTETEPYNGKGTKKIQSKVEEKQKREKQNGAIKIDSKFFRSDTLGTPLHCTHFHPCCAVGRLIEADGEEAVAVAPRYRYRERR